MINATIETIETARHQDLYHQSLGRYYESMTGAEDAALACGYQRKNTDISYLLDRIPPRFNGFIVIDDYRVWMACSNTSLNGRYTNREGQTPPIILPTQFVNGVILRGIVDNDPAEFVYPLSEGFILCNDAQGTVGYEITHRPQGKSVKSAWPSLAAKDKVYVINQMMYLLEGLRHEGFGLLDFSPIDVSVAPDRIFLNSCHNVIFSDDPKMISEKQKEVFRKTWMNMGLNLDEYVDLLMK